MKPADIVRQEGNNKELINLRTAYSKTFDMGGGNHRLVYCAFPVHIRTMFTERETDFSFRYSSNLNKWVANELPFSVYCDNNRLKISFQSGKGRLISLQLLQLDDVDVNFADFEIKTTERGLNYVNTNLGISINIILQFDKIKIFKKLRDSNSPKKLIWRVIGDNEIVNNFTGVSLGWDKQRRTCEVNYGKSNIVDRGSRSTLIYTEEWTGRISKARDRNRTLAWFDESELTDVYPVTIDPSVNNDTTETGASDGIIKLSTYNDTGPGAPANTGFVSTFAVLSLGYLISPQSGSPVPRNKYFYRDIGLHFVSIGVPQGSTINTATLKLYRNTINNAPISFRIFGENVDNGAALGVGFSRHPYNWTRTASVYKTATGSATGLRSYAITNAIQTIVNRAGFVTNNAINIGLTVNQPATWNPASFVSKKVTFNSEEQGTNPPLLVIDYTAPAASPGGSSGGVIKLVGQGGLVG